ncbi:hypothetical protein NHP200010_11510 [Helicobacter bizzozeronii]|uniref:hypothetical protein n=1 Tax=Helicobacter bizzozeronii TaxID=56877 RepID=UPI00244D8EF1|nr:hypothetical protein [Helicobacter bizzozeronii]GMB93432.1 hypothetical protein NHP200010_11510 [Helicobacter bizzozeronii]
MGIERKEKLKALVGVFVAFALVLSIAQNIHYFLKYNSSLAALLVLLNAPHHSDQKTKKEIEKGIHKQETNQKDDSATGDVLKDLIKEASKQGISKQLLLVEIKEKLE